MTAEDFKLAHRRGAVMALAEATGREGLARHLAANSDLSIDEVRGILAAAPKARRTLADVARDQLRREGLTPVEKPTRSSSPASLADLMRQQLRREGRLP